ncbi:MAG: hypothetical protein GXX84_02680 [Acidobacteria bacterium]|nr:hypothetical protein [Acidobacteriota bacterium]
MESIKCILKQGIEVVCRHCEQKGVFEKGPAFLYPEKGNRGKYRDGSHSFWGVRLQGMCKKCRNNTLEVHIVYDRDRDADHDLLHPVIMTCGPGCRFGASVWGPQYLRHDADQWSAIEIVDMGDGELPSD